MKILVTGSAGFIGFHLAGQLLRAGHSVVGLDNLNEYYSLELKQARLQALTDPNFSFVKLDIAHSEALERLFTEQQFDFVVHLAAQAGVRYSLEAPSAYVQSNLLGFANILECCRRYPVQHLVYASTSSVYGLNVTQPFSEQHGADHPVSLYAATKKSNEMMAHAYSHLFQIPTTGLRFFTVYGPWGRPDMALFSFTKSILAGQPIKIFNHGEMYRDFTYISDIVSGIEAALFNIPRPDAAWDAQAANPATSSAPYRLFNLGRGQAVSLMEFVTTLEKCLNRTAIKEYLPIQPGDVVETFADTTESERLLDYRPSVDIEQGISMFVDWYMKFYHP